MVIPEAAEAAKLACNVDLWTPRWIVVLIQPAASAAYKIIKRRLKLN